MSNPNETKLLNAIRDPIRLQIIFLLSQQEVLNVGDIARNFQISRPAVSHHLRILKEAEVIRNEKHGQEVYYQVNRKSVVIALRALADRIENCLPPE